MPIRTLEQLANVKVRYAVQLRREAQQREAEGGEKAEATSAQRKELLEDARKRLELALGFGATTERLSLLGSCLKRLALESDGGGTAKEPPGRGRILQEGLSSSNLFRRKPLLIPIRRSTGSLCCSWPTTLRRTKDNRASSSRRSGSASRRPASDRLSSPVSGSGFTIPTPRCCVR